MKSDFGHWFCASWRIMDASSLHEEIRGLLGEGTECHAKGDLIPDQPGERWPNDIFSLSPQAMKALAHLGIPLVVSVAV